MIQLVDFYRAAWNADAV